MVLRSLPRMALYPFEKPRGLYTRRMTRTKPLAGFLNSVVEDDMFGLITAKNRNKDWSCQIKDECVYRCDEKCFDRRQMVDWNETKDVIR
jgi:hypothetical protein